ncbi:NAD(P)-dependent dehydrogenase (short-subunit alcohol dehydrogenase family) [Pseudomonas sp. JUb42]|jgi:NAD(P)-dependent dehydrogenase (short-subunit alcohol dehydrogenase family)|uniref:SDR family oxidoreductase n=1 Tax=Pseudomonas sp. JUb42 TaxID=2940611 RepID=UPI002169D91A|nr:SDR family oxidoreductase [Pseudomonas sp. JUb42]MCS3470043.1 NAD(P)-dependent dehydrogenase (short-subunit alcohol dehydrogenase family) [Pseudomonas sp. JUb42]
MSTTWLITGSSSGIGLALVEHLLERGDRVAATLRKPEVLKDLQARYGERLWTAALDVNDTAAIRRVIERAFSELGRIDVVVSNAGYALFGAAEEVSDEQIELQLQTNLLGSIQVIRACLPRLRAQGGGRILQVSSEGGQLAYPNFSLYHTSKWAIEGFVESVALEVAPFGIQITLVEPGPTRTNFGAALVSPPVMPEYDNTPAGDVRRAIASGAFPLTGDPQKMARAMLDIAQVQVAPRRLLLGRGAYERVHAALSQRLAELEHYREQAMGTEID